MYAIASEQAVWDRVGIETLDAIAKAHIASEEAVLDRMGIETLYAIARAYTYSQ